MVPIIRWTITQTNKLALHCLFESIKSWKSLYGESFEYYVCYNNVNEEILSYIKKLNVNILDQYIYKSTLKIAPFDTAWKLYPPRIRLNSHEIFIDNDLIVYKHLPCVEEFLKSKDMFLITAAHGRFYGIWDFLVPKDFPNVNSGFFAIPPKFDLQKSINNAFTLFPDKTWQTHFDEEGIIAAIIKNKNRVIIPMDEIYVANPKMSEYQLGKAGTHFAGLNSNNIKYFLQYLNYFKT